jgi:hypothetical protein
MNFSTTQEAASWRMKRTKWQSAILKFNMNELEKCAVEGVGGPHARFVRVEKPPDGMFNKGFLFTMQDGCAGWGQSAESERGTGALYHCW